MTLKEKCKLWMPREGRRGGARIYISSRMVNDSQWPLNGDYVMAEIDVEREVVILSPINEEKS